MSAPRPDLAAVIATTADEAALGANAPALLLETQAQLGWLSAIAAELTERGRRPFRPDEAWADALGRLAFGVYHLADQTGVDLDAKVRGFAAQVSQSARAAEQAVSVDEPWPFAAE
jgi:hypothetical protein